MTPRNPTKPLIPYLRQSRAKEKTISIEEQRRIIHTWAKQHGVELGAEVIEQGVSGSKNWRDRELGQVIDTCADGAAQGVVVAFQDRLTRENGLGTAEVWAALETAHARLVCAGEGLDTATGDHEMLFQIKAAIAREQWKRHRTNWLSARQNAVERGVSVSRANAGYKKDEDTGKLVPNEDAPRILAAFEARAKGATFASIAKQLEGVTTSQGNTTWSETNVRRLLSNRVYLGEVRSGEYVNTEAHESIVGPGLFSKVQALARKPRTGDYARKEKHPLSGLLRCASCGSALTPDYSTGKGNGKKYRFFRCSNRQQCSAKVTIGLDTIQSYVDAYVYEAVQGTNSALVLPTASAPDNGPLESELLEAEAELKLYVETTSISAIGAELFTAGLTQRQERVKQTQEALAEATPQAVDYDIPAELADELRNTNDGLELRGEALSELLTHHLSTAARRALYHKLFDRIVVRPGRESLMLKVDVWVGGHLVPPPFTR
jgi:DNA invertase Pin-like site-specific DNA recombinase